MGFTPRIPICPQSNVSPAKPPSVGRLEKKAERRWLFQTIDKPAGAYSVPELKTQLGINNGEWKNITDEVYTLFEASLL